MSIPAFFAVLAKVLSKRARALPMAPLINSAGSASRSDHRSTYTGSQPRSRQAGMKSLFRKVLLPVRLGAARNIPEL
ncbi:hypothetical protein D3C79_934250 [compost metagenome]